LILGAFFRKLLPNAGLSIQAAWERNSISVGNFFPIPLVTHLPSSAYARLAFGTSFIVRPNGASTLTNSPIPLLSGFPDGFEIIFYSSETQDRNSTMKNNTNENSRAKILPLLGLITAFPTLSTDMYLPAIPTLQRICDQPLVLINLTLIGFFLSYCSFLLLYGPLSDRYGRRGPLMTGVIL
jgi:hypothetical protein